MLTCHPAGPAAGDIQFGGRSGWREYPLRYISRATSPASKTHLALAGPADRCLADHRYGESNQLAIPVVRLAPQVAPDASGRRLYYLASYSS